MQHHDDQFDQPLDPDLMAGFASEPRIPPAVEEQLVEALHERGVLQHKAMIAVRSDARRGARRFVLQMAMAASIVLAFVAGASFGASKARNDNFNGLTARDASMSSAAASQRLGAAALDYLDVLGSIHQSDSAAARVAILSVRAAGDEIVRIAPESDLAQAMRMVSLGLLRVDPTNATALASNARLVWY